MLKRWTASPASDAKDLYLALGYGGNGITFGAIAAEILRDQFCGVPNADAELFRFERPGNVDFRLQDLGKTQSSPAPFLQNAMSQARSLGEGLFERAFG